MADMTPTYWLEVMRALEQAPPEAVAPALPPAGLRSPSPGPGYSVGGLPPSPRAPARLPAAAGLDAPVQATDPEITASIRGKGWRLPPNEQGMAWGPDIIGPNVMDAAPPEPSLGLAWRSPFEKVGGGVAVRNPFVPYGEKGSVPLKTPVKDRGDGSFEFQSPFLKGQDTLTPDKPVRRSPGFNGSIQPPMSGVDDVVPPLMDLNTPPPPAGLPSPAPGSPQDAMLSPRPRPAAEGAAAAADLPAAALPAAAPATVSQDDVVGAAVDNLRKADMTRGGNLTTTPKPSAPLPVPAEVAAADPAVAGEGLLPGKWGERQQKLRGLFGLDPTGASNIGLALMKGGATMMSTGDIGEAVGSGVDTWIGAKAARDVLDQRQQGLDQDKVYNDARIAQMDQSLSQAREEFEFRKREAALDRLDPMKKLREERDQLALKREIDQMKNGGGWDDFLTGLTATQAGRARIEDAVSKGRLTRAQADAILGDADGGLGALLGDQ